MIVAVIWSCNDQSPQSLSEVNTSDLEYPDVGDLPPPGFVDYFLHWQLKDIQAQSEGWSTESNLGYTVSVDNGWISNYRVTLAQCTATGSLNPLKLLVQSAHANDGGEIDLSESSEGVAENLSDFTNQKWTRRPLQAHPYCKLHHLMARADETIRMRPTDIDLNRITLLIEGSAEKDGVTMPFSLMSSFAHGSLHDLNERLTLHGSKTDLVGSERIQVVLERHPAKWFDDIDFQEVTQRQLGYMIGDQIINTTVYQVKAQD